MWTYNGKEITDEELEGYVAFVYLITNLTNGKRYIGKKNLHFTRSKKVKGKTRRKRVKTESDWISYFGSSNTLLADVAALGKENFRREILHLCETRGTANYLEAKEILIRDAIISENYYNESLRVRIHRSHVKICF